ncbi:PIF1-like helicase domain-containing protein [Hirsutella rhossiliensis]|uniref:ATP-dependent DNA helicase n=1 Tax=Hirsutella rhossiliensis TaxID=111463 RepID=A0A9P8MQY2_9HYPO|nr:PIF1-like helicase domain-containing protein [Hirsutella rhossiliensis]KAH0959807.1 PIF1-like helicase domain-containing protein [Hirsutella rhossiliensis]
MEDQRRPSRAAGYPASADTECGGNGCRLHRGRRALAAAGRAQRRLGLRKGQRAPREIRSLPTAETAGPSPPQTRSSDAPRDIRPQPTWRAAGPSLPSNGIGLATASAGSKGAPQDTWPQPTWRAAGPSPPSSGTSPAVVSAGSQHVPRAIQSRPASRGEAPATTPPAAGPLVSGRDSAPADAETKELQAEDLASALRHLDEEFEAGERLANEQTWCAPVPRERQVRTVRRFYRAFHDAGTLPIATCTLCYRKRAKGELREMAWEGWSRSSVAGGGRSRFGCRSCFPEGRPVPVCVECARWAGREGASPAMHLHGRLGCEHAYPDELKDLTPLEEKLISLNSCYGFVTKYSIPGGQRQSVRYPRHVKGHITVFPNDVQGLAAKVLPHPLLRVMDEIHVSWQGAEARAARPIGPAENNPLYGEVEIDAAEMASWGAAARVPPVVCVSRDVGLTCEDDDGDGARPEEDGDVINEVTSSGMFPLDGAPEVADAEKIRFARGAVGPEGARAGPRTWVGTAAREAEGDGGDVEPHIQVRRGEDFADSADASFFAKAFPTLFPFGLGGPRLADEDATGESAGPSVGNQGTQAERVAEGLMSTRNMKLQAWADVVLRRHGGRFATHPIFAFLVFNMGGRGPVKVVNGAEARGGEVELEATGKTSDDGVKELIRSLSVFGYRQPMSRESRLIAASGTPRPRPDEAEAFLRDLGTAYKRTQLAISDPMSSAVFFHREMTLFFEHYVNVGEEGNAGLGEALAGPDTEKQAAYRERIVRYVDSVFSEELDAEGYCAVQAERSATADISSRLDDVARFTDTFDEEANFCAGATQIHTHSATCVKYSLGARARKGDLCRFKAPWRLVEDGADGGRGLRHNHDISFIATQRKTMALIYYITNYATKVEDPVWKRVAAAAEFLPALEPTGEGNGSGADRDAGRGGGAEGVATAADPIGGNKTRTFLLKAANRVFTERPLSQVEVIAHLLGYPAEFSSGSAWAYVNANQLYWAVFRRWRHLRRASGAEATGDAPDETVVVEEAGPRIPLVEAYRHRGELLRGLCLYDYASLVRLKRNGRGADGGTGWGEVPFAESWASGKGWVQALRRPGSGATVCLDGYLSKEFSEGDDESCHRRAAVQHLALFVPWESFLGEEAGDINDIWARARESLAPRSRGSQTTCSSSGGRRRREGGRGGEEAYRAGGAGDAARLIDVVRNAAGAGQVTAQSTELLAMTQQLCRFQQSALGSEAELAATVVAERAGRRVNLPGSELSGAALPRQEEVRAIKSQQRSAARERERAIQGIQGGGAAAGVGADRGAALRGVMGGFGEDDMDVTAADGDVDAGTAAVMRAIALLIVCRQLDRIRQGDDAGGDGGGQLCLFIGGEGGTGKSRVIEALVELLARRTYRAGCWAAGREGDEDVDGVRLPGQGERFVDGRSRMDWQEKEVLVIDEVSMLGARTLHAANEQLCRLRGSARDFGGIPVVIFCGDFHQFRPVQERSILLPSAAVAWDEDGAFAAEQRRQHDKAHALWRRFTTVVMLDEQMRAAGDPELRRLLGRIRRGEQDRSDLELLNSRCHRPGRRIPWETGLTVVTPLNRNRWNLNLEAALAFRARRRTAARIFLSEHKWREGLPTEEEAVLMLCQGDDSATPVPAVFVFVPGMPVVVNQNTHQGLKLVNGAGYTAVDVIPDRAFPGHRVSAELTMHFGPPAGIVLASETTRDFHFVGMPAGTILLTPISVKITAQRKRPWQRNDVSRRGLPCAAAFACTDYKVQGGTLERVALELRGEDDDGRGEGGAVAVRPVQPVRERDLVGNRVPEEMTAAQARLEELSRQTTQEAADWLRG